MTPGRLLAYFWLQKVTRIIWQKSAICYIYKMNLYLKKIKPTQPAHDSADDLPAVVILHGLYGSGANWHNVARIIADTLGQDVYTLDLPNHGHSGWTERFSYSSVTEDVLGWLRENPEKFPAGIVFLGHSLGGRVAMISAARSEDIRGLAMADISPFTDSKQDRIITLVHGMLLHRMLEAKEQGVKDKDIDSHLREQGVDMSAMGSLRQPYSQMNLEVVADKVMGLLPDYLYIHTHEDYGRLRNLPTLFIRGGVDSMYIPQAAVDNLSSRFDNYRVTTVEGTTHNLYNEKSPEVAIAFTEWYSANFC